MASVEAQVERFFDRYGPRYRWLATITVMLGTMSVVLASTIINVAIPTIMVEFQLAQDQVHWLATGFLAAMTVGMLLNAWCAQRFGARGAYLLAMGLFIVVSIIGAVSEQFPLLVAARIGQGLLAGLVQPLAMITIFQVFPLNRRGQAMGIYGLGVVLGPAIAPAIGGVLVDTLSWRAVFLVVLPACVVGMAMAWRYLPGKDREAPPLRLDTAGVLLLAMGMTAVLWVSCTCPGRKHRTDTVHRQGLLHRPSFGHVFPVLPWPSPARLHRHQWPRGPRQYSEPCA